MSQFSTVDPSKYVAVYKTDDRETTIPLVAMEVLEGRIVGYILPNTDDPAMTGFQRADRFHNFDRYAAVEQPPPDAVIVPAPPGWWVVWKNDEDGSDREREPIVAWRVQDDEDFGYEVRAILPPGRRGSGVPADPTSMPCEFRYEPESTEAWRPEPSQQWRPEPSPE